MRERQENKGVLVVDDDPKILTSVRDLLEDDFVVSTADNAESGLRMLEQREVAVILSDQRMPGVSGDQFLRMAEERSQASRVLITGYSDVEALVRAVNDGHIYAYVAKPWDAKDFKNTVARAAQHYDLTREVHESEQRFRSLFEEAPIGYVEINREAAITAVNRAANALLGYSRGELSGKCFWDLMRSEHRGDLQGGFGRGSGGTRATDVLEQEFIRRGGELIMVELHQSPIANHVGEVEGLRAAILDISARKMAEQTAKQYALELAIKNEELEQALQRAHQASAIKGEFLAKMSHELRTPLNGIIGLCQLIYDGVVGVVQLEQREYLGDVLASSMHLLGLVNDLLDLEKVASGKMDFCTEAVDAARLLKEVKDVLRPLADEKKISVTLEVDATLQTVFTDPGRAKQVLYNYLSNAIKFTPDGGAVRVILIREDF